MSTTLRFELPLPVLGGWRYGNTGVEGVWQFTSANPGPTVMVSALLHGNELCGAWAVCDALQSGLRPRAGSLVFAFCNLDAFDCFDAAAPDASRFVDEDMNRVWGPAVHRLDAGSRERHRARQLAPFVERADLLLDLHSMHEPGAPLLLTGTLQRNVVLARQLRTPEICIVDAGHADGVRMRDHGRFGAAGAQGARSLLVECGWHGALSSRDVARDVLGRFLVLSQAVEPADVPNEWLRPDPGPQRVLEVTHRVVAQSQDLQFAGDWASGECIAEAGTVLGWDGGQAFSTPYDQCTLVMPSLRQLRPGVTVMRLARTQPAC